MKEFAEQLKKIQDERGITQKQMAEIVGVSQNTISAYMRDMKSPSLNLVARFAKALNVSIDYLCGEAKVAQVVNLRTYNSCSEVIAMFNSVTKLLSSGGANNGMEHMTTKEGRAAIREFFAALGKRCSSVPDGENCPACDMRLFCYAAPPDKTAMIDQVISFLENRD